MMKNPVKLCDLKKQTKISIEPVFDREFLTWAALIRYEIEVQKFSWVDFYLDNYSDFSPSFKLISVHKCQ